MPSRSCAACDRVTRYGMDEGLGYVVFETARQQMLDLPAGMLPRDNSASEDTQRRIDNAIRRIVMDSFDRAITILSANREVLEHGARSLLEKETLDEAALRDLSAQLQRVDPNQSLQMSLPLDDQPLRQRVIQPDNSAAEVRHC